MHPRPTNSGVREVLGRGCFIKMNKLIISLLVGGGYPQPCKGSCLTPFTLYQEAHPSSSIWHIPPKPQIIPNLGILFIQTLGFVCFFSMLFLKTWNTKNKRHFQSFYRGSFSKINFVYSVSLEKQPKSGPTTTNVHSLRPQGISPSLR